MVERVVIPINYIERKPDSNKYRIVGKGITVEFLSRLIDHPDWPINAICENYNLTPAEIYAAWSFYFDHKAEIDQRLAEESARYMSHAEETRARHEELLRRYEEKHGKKWEPSTE